MAKTCKRWTDEEDKISVQALSANPHNLEKGFREAATKLGRTERAASQHWYSNLRKRVMDREFKTSYSSITLSRSKSLICGKSYVPESGHKNAPRTIKVGLWSKIKSILGL